MLAKVGALESIGVSQRHIPARRVSLTFKVGHEGLGTAIQSVDDHLPVSGAGDFDATVLETRGGLDAMPRGLVAYGGCLWEEVERNARVVAALGIFASVEKRLAGGFEGSVESSEELESVLCEKLGLCFCSSLGVDLYACDHDDESWIAREGSASLVL